jgi:hypothetical protein
MIAIITAIITKSQQKLYSADITVKKTDWNIWDEPQLNYISDLFFFNSHSEGWSPNWVHSARRPFTGLLYQPRVIIMMSLVE